VFLLHLRIFAGGLLMVVERDLLISLLKLTKNGVVTQESVCRDARVPSSVGLKLLQKLQNANLVYLNDDVIDVDSSSRLQLGVRAVELGADVERVSEFLDWQEFEAIAALALERNGYGVAKNLRFKHAGRRWEIDVVGCRKPLVVCVDCKHWRHGISPSALAKIVAAQVDRVESLADFLPGVSVKVECVNWDRANFVPVILSLVPSRFKFYDNVPVVPVLQFQDFLSQLPAYLGSLKCFVKEFRHL
jgi:Holliday junction resolvase-like predicted endonuclease